VDEGRASDTPPEVVVCGFYSIQFGGSNLPRPGSIVFHRTGPTPLCESIAAFWLVVPYVTYIFGYCAFLTSADPICVVCRCRVVVSVAQFRFGFRPRDRRALA